MKPYSFKAFWLPYIIMFWLMTTVTISSGSLDSALGILMIGIFYFYNRGLNFNKKE